MTAYTYDPAGNRKTETVTLSGQATTIEYTVDSLNRLTKTVTQEEHTTVTNTYCYDPTGNLISRVPEVLKSAVQNELPSLSLAASLGTEDLPVALYTYNQRNQMIIAEVGTQRVENTFNAEGLRVSKTANGVTAQYQYEYDKIVKEIDSEGNTVYNIYGINLISREVGGQKLFYLYNGHSDVTALVNRMGQVVKTYYYDAFGNAVEESGSCANPYRYAGYRYDEESGLYDLKARFYDATVARFMQEDTYGGQANDPLSLNRYVYCRNNPLVYWDPTGHWEKDDDKYTEETQRAILELTYAYYATQNPAERDEIHKQAKALRIPENEKKAGSNSSMSAADQEKVNKMATGLNTVLSEKSHLTQNDWDTAWNASGIAVRKGYSFSVLGDKALAHTTTYVYGYQDSHTVLSISSVEGMQYVNGTNVKITRTVKNSMYLLVTSEQLEAIGWSDTSEKFVQELNSALYKYGIVDEESIAIFMATPIWENGEIDADNYLVTAEQLIKLGFAGVDDNMVADLNRVLYKYNITDTEAIRHFLAQVLYESGGGLYSHEGDQLLYGSNPMAFEQIEAWFDANKFYGAKWRGAGYIQLSTERNYKAFAKDMDDPFILQLGNNYVADFYAWEAAGWFWDQANMNYHIENSGWTSRNVSSMVLSWSAYGKDDGSFSQRENLYKKVCEIIK